MVKITFKSEIYFPYISFSFKNNLVYETHLSKPEENIQLIFLKSMLLRFFKNWTYLVQNDWQAAFMFTSLVGTDVLLDVVLNVGR